MNCPRCHGLMVYDRVYGPEEVLFELPIWRCLNCGDTVDPLILENRRKHEQETNAAKTKAA